MFFSGFEGNARDQTIYNIRIMAGKQYCENYRLQNIQHTANGQSDYVKKLTLRDTNMRKTDKVVATLDSRFDLAGSRQHGVANSKCRPPEYQRK